MTVDPPRFDKVNADSLVHLAQDHLAERGGAWRAADAADPGLALIEAFATVTAAEIDRINALPHRLQAQFLSMLGARLRARAAETVMLRFDRAQPGPQPLVLPAGLRVAASGDPSTVVALLEPVTIAPGDTVAEGLAARVEMEAPVRAARATGLPSQTIQLPHTDLVGAPTAAAVVSVLVDWSGHDVPPGTDPESFDGRPCIRFHEVDRLDAVDTAAHVVVDRVAGRLRFPAIGPHIPPQGAAIFVGYCHAGGQTGAVDLPEGSLRDLLTPVPGVTVSNPAPPMPGRAPETAVDRLSRGPMGMLAGDLAFRARDYEALALDAHPSVARAHALTPAARWIFATPGTVRVLVAPHTVPARDGTIGAEAYMAARDASEGDGRHVLDAIRARLDAAAPLGVALEIGWLPALPVGVDLVAFVTPGTDHAATEAELRATLGAVLSPVGNGEWPEGWPMGRTLRKSQLLERLLGLPGIRAIDRLVLRPRDPMEGRVQAIAADCAQHGAWFVAMGGPLYRTLDDGVGWTRAALPEGAGPIAALAAHPLRSGLAAAVSEDGTVYATRDCGQAFEVFSTGPPGAGAALWADGGEAPRLLIAGEADLCETSGPPPEGGPGRPRSLLAADGARVGPAHALASYPDGRGGRLVAVARRELGGVVISHDSGWDGSYRPAGLQGEDVRALCFVSTGVGELWLVAGLAAPVVAGQTAMRIARVDPDMAQVLDWVEAAEGWPGGTVRGLAAGEGGAVLGVSETAGLSVGRVEDGVMRWQVAGADHGLPTARSRSGMAGLSVIAARAPSGGRPGGLMVGGTDHLLHSDAGGARFAPVAQTHGLDQITLPQDWVLCSDAHRIEVRDVTD